MGYINKDGSWLERATSRDHFEIFEENKVWTNAQAQTELTIIPFEPDPNLRIWTENRSIMKIIESFITPIHLRAKKMPKSVFEKQRLMGLKKTWEKVTVHQMLNQAYMMTIDKNITQTDLIELVHGLRDMLEAFPERAAEIPALIKSMDLDTKASSLIVQALELIGHTEAQDALKEIISGDDFKHDIQIQAIVAASGLKKPEENITKTLWDTLEGDMTKIDVDSSKMKQDEKGDLSEEDQNLLNEGEKASTALLALGALSKAYRENGDLANADIINQQIVELMKKSNGSDSLAIGMMAMDNSGDLSQLGDLTPYLESKSSQVRAAAVNSLRHDNTDPTLRTLADIVKTDDNKKVRGTATQILQDHGGNIAIDTFVDSIAKEKDEELRAKMIEYLGKNKSEFPGVLESLQKHKSVETDRDVMKELYRAIYRDDVAEKLESQKKSEIISIPANISHEMTIPETAPANE
jgi:HEAT repeat protein